LIQFKILRFYLPFVPKDHQSGHIGTLVQSQEFRNNTIIRNTKYKRQHWGGWYCLTDEAPPEVSVRLVIAERR